MPQQMHQEENCHCHPKEVTLQWQRLGGGEESLEPQASQQEGPDAQVLQTQEEGEVRQHPPGQGGVHHTSALFFGAFVGFSS